MNQNADELDSQLLLGRYRIVQRLGEGGMGTVHLARIEGAEGFTRPVVVKRMRADIKSTEEGNRLFKREAQILSKMQHPGIVNILDFGVEGGAHIMVLEYMHGYTLTPLLDYRFSEKKQLPVDICLYIVRKVLDALHYAHHFDSDEGQQIEIVHRDVAPDNILLSKKGYVHLLDFGVASIRGPAGNNSTETGAFRGKLGYAAPETVHGEVATPRCDQYSAAAVLWELLTQETPFSSDSIGLTVQKMATEALPRPSSIRPDVPEELDRVIARALEKDPERRFESANELARQLRRLQTADDDQVAQDLSDLVREDFEILPDKVGIESLKSREEALARELHGEPAPASVDYFDPNTLPGTREGRRTGRDSATTIGVGASVSPQSRRDQRELKRLLMGLLIVGGVIALALGAAVALLSKSGSGQQVVVVGEDDDGESLKGPTLDDADSGSSGRPVAEDQQLDVEPGQTSNAGSDERASTTGETDKQPHLSGEQAKLALASAVRQQSGAFRSCFQSHVEAAKKLGQVQLEFSVSTSGSATRIAVAPRSSNGSPLGSCLLEAARQVRFPPLAQPTSFSVPLHARVAD